MECLLGGFFFLEFLLEIWSSECGWLTCYNVGTRIRIGSEFDGYDGVEVVDTVDSVGDADVECVRVCVCLW
jgi:hypothetical protein